MSTISVPMPTNLEAHIELMVKQGKASNKADFVRRAVSFYVEEQAIKDVQEAMQELKDGKILRGDLRDLMKQIP